MLAEFAASQSPAAASFRTRQHRNGFLLVAFLGTGELLFGRAMGVVIRIFGTVISGGTVPGRCPSLPSGPSLGLPPLRTRVE